MSKYSPVEFWNGAKHFEGTRSPNVGERTEKGYSDAWLHHKGRNRHHFEYWTDYDANKHCVVPVKMPLRYVAEMFCDRVAASKIYRGGDYKSSDLSFLTESPLSRELPFARILRATMALSTPTERL